MINRYEFLTFRIDNALAEKKARPHSVAVDGLGKIAVSEVNLGEVTIGKFATSRRQLVRHNVMARFIESAFDPGDVARQLWLPYEPDPSKRKRAIIATSAESARRFNIWQDVASLADNLNDYDPYDEQTNALYEEAKLLLHLADARDESFGFEVSGVDTFDKLLTLAANLQSVDTGSEDNLG